jgi:glycosyltransferase involved in cell wall biosynthesis
MILNFLCPSAPHPIGGVTALYEYANGMVRRGHHVRAIHAPFLGCRITSIDELSWFRFEPGLEHVLIEDGDPGRLPDGDIFFGADAPPAAGLPVVIIQGVRMLTLGWEREAFRQPCLKFCVASWLRDVGERWGSPPEQLVLVPLGIDHERFRLEQPLADRAPQVAILHHDHLAKGWQLGWAALQEVHRRMPTMRAMVFGTSAPTEPLPDWATFRLAPDHTTLASEVFNTSQILLQASHHEGFGLTAVEAMACGAALVTTDNGGSRDYAFDGETALVTPAGDVGGLVAGVEALLGDPGRRIAIAETGRTYVRRFDWDRSARIMEEHLERYLADPSAYQEPPAEDRGKSPEDYEKVLEWLSDLDETEDSVA